MRKLFLIMSFILIGVLGYSQGVKKVRVDNATALLPCNLGVTAEVTNIATGEIWQCRTPTAKTFSLTTAAGNFTIINGAGTDSQDLSYNSTTHSIEITGGNDAVIPLGTNTVDGLMTTGKFDEVEANNDKLTANTTNVTNAGALMDTEVDEDIKTLALPANTTISTFGASLVDDTDATAARTTLDVDQAGTDNSTDVTLNASATTGGLSITEQEISNQAGTNSQNGYITSTLVGNIETNNDKVSNVSTSLSTGTVDASTYGITSDGGADDVIIAAATNTAAGVATATQITKLEGISTGAEVNLVQVIDKFEETSGTAITHTLTYTSVGAIIVSFNGAILDPSFYTSTTTSVHIDITVGQYDELIVYYNK